MLDIVVRMVVVATVVNKCGVLNGVEVPTSVVDNVVVNVGSL